MRVKPTSTIGLITGTGAGAHHIITSATIQIILIGATK
jgi:hypothetical protein